EGSTGDQVHRGPLPEDDRDPVFQLLTKVTDAGRPPREMAGILCLPGAEPLELRLGCKQLEKKARRRIEDRLVACMLECRPACVAAGGHFAPRLPPAPPPRQ